MRAGGVGHASGRATPITYGCLLRGSGVKSKSVRSCLLGREIEALSDRLVGLDVDGERALDLVLGIGQHDLVRARLELHAERRGAARLPVDGHAAPRARRNHERAVAL